MLARPSFVPSWFGAAPSSRRLRVITLGAALVAVAQQLPVRSGIVVGCSMVPTLQPGQPFLYRKTADGERYRRGEVVVLRLGGNVCVKRVFAVGGDSVWSFSEGPKDGAVRPLLEVGADLHLWKRRYPMLKFHRLRVPAGSVFVVGDGITSVDSRQLGPAPEEAVLGRVILSPGRNGGRAQVAWTLPPPQPRSVPRS